MDGLQPSERPVATRQPIAGGGALRLHVDQPPQPVGAQWLTEFLRREGVPEDRSLPSIEVLDEEPAQKSYKAPVLIGFGVLLAIGAVGAFAYQRVIVTDYHRWIAAAVAAMNGPAPPHPVAPVALAAPALEPAPKLSPPPASPPPQAQPKPPQAPPTSAPALGLSAAPRAAPTPPHQEMLTPLGNPAMALASFPQQPVDPPPTVMSNWAGALVIPTPLAGEPNIAAADAPAAPQAVPAALHAAPSTVPALLPGSFALPAGTPVHLRIVYTPSDPAEASRIDALAKRLSSQIPSIASVTAAAGPAAFSGVAYFFPGDRAGASRVAASLARMTRRAEPLLLIHANPLPRPGTIEIRLPLRVGKELNNERD
jgi:hypothetical protein